MDKDELDILINELIDNENTVSDSKDEELYEPDIFKRKRPKHPTNDPNPVRYPGRKHEDVGFGWHDTYIGPGVVEAHNGKTW